MKSRILFHKESLASRPLPIVCVVEVLLVLGSVHSYAHQGDRIYPIYEITDEMLELIDLEDGRIDEWEELFEPSITTLDFTRKILDRNTSKREIVSYDPSDLDFQIWLVWNETHNRLYVSGQFADDIHVRDKEGKRRRSPDYMYFHVDGDHSGGEYRGLTGDRYWEDFTHAQTYTAPFFYELEFPLGLSYNTFGQPYEFSWVGELPYAHGGEGANGENPVVWNVEFFITPFDFLDPEPENSIVSELDRNKIIGFYIVVGDGEVREESDSYSLDEVEGAPGWTADDFVDGFLIGAGEFAEGSAVQPSSWGMIKASLGY